MSDHLKAVVSGPEDKKIHVLLTHPGTQYSYQLAAQLERMGILHCFVTGFALGADNKPVKWLPFRLRKKLLRRTVAGVPGKRLFALFLLEWKALWQIKLGGEPEKIFYRRNKAFQEQIPQQLIDEASIVIGFDTASWILIERCREAGKPFVLDASIAHPLSQQAVFDKLRNQYPSWSAQLPVKDPALIALEQGEIEKADTIVVASGFTKNTYLAQGIPATRIAVNPYGTDLSFFRSKWEAAPEISHHPSPVRFLFFSKISARKGFPWLCAVWQRFHAQYPDTKLIAAGYHEPPTGFVLPDGIALTGFVHPADRPTLFEEADVFVFPSFFEGFAQVIIEAMACGLPVITTTHTIGPEVITAGEEGFCIVPGEDEALFSSLEYFVQHPENIAIMGKKARNRVLPLTWDAYGERWGEICRSLQIPIAIGTIGTDL